MCWCAVDHFVGVEPHPRPPIGDRPGYSPFREPQRPPLVHDMGVALPMLGAVFPHATTHHTRSADPGEIAGLRVAEPRLVA